ncbi:MAG: twin-arginine translocase TatA/TatE family subunit [Paludibacteraceae bacterium]|nr:twin-arginine translocase TatA/TatE family subunit [Paludibacteraceae bacterium]
MIGSSEIIFIVLLVLLLFGGKKIPELMRGLGKGVKSFKEGMNGVDEQPAPSQKKNDSQDLQQQREEKERENESGNIENKKS